MSSSIWYVALGDRRRAASCGAGAAVSERVGGGGGGARQLLEALRVGRDAHVGADKRLPKRAAVARRNAAPIARATPGRARRTPRATRSAAWHSCRLLAQRARQTFAETPRTAPRARAARRSRTRRAPARSRCSTRRRRRSRRAGVAGATFRAGKQAVVDVLLQHHRAPRSDCMRALRVSCPLPARRTVAGARRRRVVTVAARTADCRYSQPARGAADVERTRC
jgi:hypothetical protein